MKKLFVRLLVGAGLFTPALVYAQSPFLKPIKDLLGDLEIFIQFLNWALPALAILVFFILIILFILNKMQLAPSWLKLSDDKSYTKGIFGSLVALAVLFAVYGLIQLIGALVGVDTNRAKTITAPSLPQVGGVRGTQYYGGY